MPDCRAAAAGDSLAAAALELAAANWAVLPLRGKLPLTAHGKDDASTDTGQVGQWWTRWPDANIGARVADSLVVLDVDPRHGGDDSLAALERVHGPFPATLTVLSGRGDGGRHLYFSRPFGEVRNADLGPGIDLRLPGRHYCVMPPSIHSETFEPYRWVDPMATIAEPPRWFAEALRPPPPPFLPRVKSRPGSRYAEAALDGELDRVSHAVEGTRNATLNDAGFRLGTLVGAGLLPEDLTLNALVHAAVGVGLGAGEARKTAMSGLRAGRQKPRCVS